MSLQELSKFTITSKYAKYLPEKKRRETWDEISNRSLQMHLRKFNSLPTEDLEKISKAFDRVKNKEVLPSMRCAQYAGDAIERKNERIYNCCFSHIYNTRSIEKAFYLLLCGVGCGFGLGKKWVDQFPKLVKGKDGLVEFVIPDSIEGWATSVKVLLDSYLEGNEYSGKVVLFDYNGIRAKGSPLSHGGVAPGPSGLIHAHNEIKSLLDKISYDKLKTIDVYDILMHVADAVLSGGLRRAACIALFDKDDLEMLNAKTGTWFIDNPQRAKSNNTVLLKRDNVTKEDFDYIIKHTKEFGEPGFAFVNDENTGLNPCAEITFLPFWEGNSYFQMCNLTTVNGNKVQTEQDLLDFVEAATIIGTLQATYTDFKFLDEGDRKVTEEEALLGVSIMGYLANPKLLLDEKVLSKAANYATAVNEIWAEKLGINPAARVTCTKPDGNSACVLESPFSGIHPTHHRKYFRRVQVNKDEPVYQHFKKYNEHVCEESVYSATNADDIITFPIRIEAKDGVIKDDLSAIEHLEMIKSVQKNWVKEGEKNNKKLALSHSVSCTVLVGENEWEEVSEYLYNNKEYFTAVSLLARTGDKDYAQAPYEAIKTPEDFHVWNSLKQQFVPVDYTEMVEHKDNTKRNEEVACANGVCSL